MSALRPRALAPARATARRLTTDHPTFRPGLHEQGGRPRRGLTMGAARSQGRRGVDGGGVPGGRLCCVFLLARLHGCPEVAVPNGHGAEPRAPGLRATVRGVRVQRLRPPANTEPGQGRASCCHHPRPRALPHLGCSQPSRPVGLPGSGPRLPGSQRFRTTAHRRPQPPARRTEPGNVCRSQSRAHKPERLSGERPLGCGRRPPQQPRLRPAACPRLNPDLFRILISNSGIRLTQVGTAPETGGDRTLQPAARTAPPTPPRRRPHGGAAQLLTYLGRNSWSGHSTALPPAGGAQRGPRSGEQLSIPRGRG